MDGRQLPSEKRAFTEASDAALGEHGRQNLATFRSLSHRVPHISQACAYIRFLNFDQSVLALWYAF